MNRKNSKQQRNPEQRAGDMFRAGLISRQEYVRMLARMGYRWPA